MTRLLSIIALALVPWTLAAQSPERFRRGDCNGDGVIGGIADALTMLMRNFGGGVDVPCAAACDANDDGDTGGVTDAVYLLMHSFSGGPPPPDPYPGCGADPSPDGLECARYEHCLQAPPADARFELSDVSILFPLAASDELDLLLRPASAGPRGELLPLARYAALPKLHVFQIPEETYELLRVVAARIDPCFLAGEDCRRQIRLSLQPLVVDPIDGEVRAEDAAIHLFYDLSEEDFAALTGSLLTARVEAGVPAAGPLRVHPVLAAQGLRGTFATELRAALLRYAGTLTLSRVTFMQLQNFNKNEWVFGGFEVDGADMRSIVIVDALSERQRFINVILDSEEDFVASVEPKPLGLDDITLFFNSARARQAPAQEVAAALRAALRLENPDVHSSETVSCVACHLSTQTRLWAERSFGLTTEGHPDRYTSSEDLSLLSETTRVPSALRAFGYFHRSVAMSQRTVNESAAVVSRLNASR